MDFVFMLTRADRTIDDGPAVLEDVRALGLRHIGFKDVGIERRELGELHRRIKELGAISYLEVVGTTRDACVESARVARELGIDRLLGGTLVAEVLDILKGSAVEYFPFPGQPFDHPTKLRGSTADIARDCRRYRELGAAGVDLLAYRATDADPIELVRAARAALDGGVLLVAGGVATAAQVSALAAAGADAFTVGSAVFAGTFAPGDPSLGSQLKAVLDACA
jgi:hypothetical protein